MSWVDILGTVAILAALVIRISVLEMHRRGSAREQLAPLRDLRAGLCGVVAGGAVVGFGWRGQSVVGLWAVLVGLLIMQIVHAARRRSVRPGSSWRSTRKRRRARLHEPPHGAAWP